MAIGRVNTGGGGSGGTLVVTGVAGSTVTVSKDSKTYTRTLNSSGKATFKGLATGTWTITMTDGTQTVTRTVTITADYDLTIAYFSATISITYPAASTCVITDSEGTQIASDTNGDSNAKTWTATVGAIGTYTITATSADGGKTKSATVSITAEGQVATVELVYELVLFDNGVVDGYTWSTSGHSGTGVKNGTIYTLAYMSGTSAAKAYLNEEIDLSSYTKLYFYVTDAGYGNALYDDNVCYAGVTAADTATYLAKVTVVQCSSIPSRTNELLSVDISSVNKGHIRITTTADYAGVQGNTWVDATFSKIWLE